jgi:3-oxoacyl-[acyl-carrier protein] reductase
VLIADVEQGPAKELAAEIEATGGKAIAVNCDVTDRASVSALFDAAIDKFGQVDFVVTCAGILRFNPVEDISEAEWDQVVDTHMKGTFLCAQSARAVMAPREYGKLVLFSSGASRGYAKRLHYSAAKAGIEAMTRVLATELGELNINVNAVMPGLIETRMPHQHAEWLGEDYELFASRAVAQTPLKRVGTPADVAAAVAFLCSDDASFITGQILPVSGGL